MYWYLQPAHTQQLLFCFFAKEAQDSFLNRLNPEHIVNLSSGQLTFTALMDHQCPSQIKRECLNKRFISVQPMWLKWNLCNWIITNGVWEYGSILQSVSTVSLFSNDSMLCRCGGTVCLVATRCCSIDSIVSYVMKCERGFGKKGLAWNVLALSANSPLSKLVQLFLFWREIYYWTLEGWSYSLTPTRSLLYSLNNNGFCVKIKIVHVWACVCILFACVFTAGGQRFESLKQWHSQSCLPLQVILILRLLLLQASLRCLAGLLKHNSNIAFYSNILHLITLTRFESFSHMHR